MIAIHSIAQENLVPNPSFEQVEKKIKEAGEIELAYPWTSATLKKVDLYSADAKNKDFGVPENAYGEEKAQDGSNYVGLNIYGYRGRAPKGYLQTELTKELVEDAKGEGEEEEEGADDPSFGVEADDEREQRRKVSPRSTMARLSRLRSRM